jgi:molybdopterin synthase catalytic subunit
LKATVPIWKKEVYEDGSEWKANRECSWKGPQTPKASFEPDF